MKQVSRVRAAVVPLFAACSWIAGCSWIVACSSGDSAADTSFSSATPSSENSGSGDGTGVAQPGSSGNGETPVPVPGAPQVPVTNGPGAVPPSDTGNGPSGTPNNSGSNTTAPSSGVVPNGSVVPSGSAPNGTPSGTAPNGESNGGGPNGSASNGGNGVGGAPPSEGGGAGEGNANGGGTNGTAGAGGEPTGNSPVERYGRLQVAGNRLHGAHGRPVTLRGQGLGWDNWWPQYYNADVVAWLRDDWCVDLVRPAMGIEPDGAYLQNSAASRARIQAVVDAAIANGTYVIIDWHAHDMHQSEAVMFFSDMAEAYGSSPNVIYEVYNEPDDETWPQVKAYAEAVIAAIRVHDPDKLVIVGSPEWDQRIDLVAADPITDNNVIYAVHFYAGAHGQWLRDRTAEALAAGIPVLVSESGGSEASGMGANNYAEWEAWFSFMDQNQISWINYSVSDKEGETISALEPGASANGGWDANQLTETGEYIRNVFREQCTY